MKYAGIGCLVLLVLGVLIIGGSVVGGYNSLVALDQAAQQAWGQVQNVYQRRADLVPNLVETVKGAANFEKDTFTQVTEARAKVGQVTTQVAGGPPKSQAQLDQFQQAQAGLGNALSRLLVVVEKYPELKATQNFRDLQAQLEGTENRIAVARRDYIESVRVYNTALRTFPTVLWAKTVFAGNKPMAEFAATDGSERPPTVKF
jgi:LemA protein